MGKVFLALLACFVLLACGGLPRHQASFRGEPLARVLEPSSSIGCSAFEAATTGYYTDPSVSPAEPRIRLTSEPLKKQTVRGLYTISFSNDQAEVYDGVAKESYQFQIHSRRADGVVLVRGKGVGVEVITIDPRSGSFVFSDSGVREIWNRASVWVGQCW